MLSCSFFNIWMWSNWSNFKFPRSKQVPMYHLDFKIFKNRVLYIYIYILSVCIAIEWFLRLLVHFFLHNVYFRHIFLVYFCHFLLYGTMFYFHWCMCISQWFFLTLNLVAMVYIYIHVTSNSGSIFRFN